MRKLIIYTGNFSEPDINAAGKRVFGNSLILEKIGFDVLLIGKKKNNSNTKREKYTEHIFFESYPEYSIIEVGKYFEYIKRIIEKERPAYIIRYGSPCLSVFDLKLLKYAHHNDIRVIADVVDWLSADGSNILFNIFKSIDTYFEKAIFNSMSDGIIAISSYLANYYRKKVTKVTIIPPIVSKYQQNIADNDQIIIMYAGVPFRIGTKVKNVHKIKDRLDLAIEAFAGLYKVGITNFQFKIYGLSKEQYIVAFPNHKTILDQIEDKIVFLGKKPMKQIQDDLLTVDYSILLREVTRGTTAGFPTKVVESMSCGTPMITTKTSDLPNYIHNGENGFFIDINDSNKLIKQLEKIIAIDSNRLKAIKENCYNNHQFVSEVYLNRMRKFLNEV